jgi:hypothetical protein
MTNKLVRPAVLRLVLAALLFSAWIGWLIYLVTTLRHVVVLSRPQLLVSDLDVIAQVDEADESKGGDSHGPRSTIKVVEITWSRDGKDRDIKSITVVNLADLVPGERSVSGWEGPGLYIVPLQKQVGADDTVEYRIPPVPRSPGYPHGKSDLSEQYRIYPATEEARRQLANIRKGDWE